MNSNRVFLTVSDMSVEFVRKDIKNVHLSVLPPDGRVRLTGPLSMSEDNARLAIVTRWRWIKKKQQQFASQKRESRREFVNGESHFFDGQKYLLSVVEVDGGTAVRIKGNGRIELRCRKDASRSIRQKTFDTFYRAHLRSLIEDKLPVFCAALNVDAPEVRIQRMRTKWGSCSVITRRVLINLELAKKPRACFEYILAHELTHLRVRHHTDEFRRLLESVMPDWQFRRDTLNSFPIAFEKWEY